MRRTICLLHLCLLAAVGCKPKQHTATTTIQIVRDDPGPISPPKRQRASEEERMDAAVKLLQSAHLLIEVKNRLSHSNQIEAFSAPYNVHGDPSKLLSILDQNRIIMAKPDSFMVGVSYAHPNPKIAVLVTNYFADLFILHHRRASVAPAMKEIEDIRKRADLQKDRIEKLELQIAELREQEHRDPEVYQDLLGELEVQQAFFLALTQRMTIQKTCYASLSSIARIIDRARLE